MNRCSRCDETLSKDGDYVTCSGCASGMHYECSGLRESTHRNMSTQKRSEWRCVTCRTSKNRTNSSSNENLDIQAAITQINNKLEILTEVNLKVSKFQDSLSEIYNELKCYKEKVENLEQVIKEKDNKIETLETRLMDIEQYSRINNVEIIGIGKQPNENLEGLFEKLCEKINVQQITAEDIDTIHRLPSKKGNEENIIVKFKGRKTRDRFLAQRKIRITNGDLLGNHDSRGIYIRENNSKEFRKMFWEIRETARARGYTYVWSRDGKIYVKKTEGDKVTRIRTKEHISSL
jgi:predicted RNase H-like nuclease (RuvC/YqgF family)